MANNQDSSHGSKIQIILDNHLPDPQPRPTFTRFIYNGHQRKNDSEARRLQAISQTEPEKSMACLRCRRLRKKCSKHAPTCLTCAKMGDECIYVEKVPQKRKRDGSTSSEASSNSYVDTPKLDPSSSNESSSSSLLSSSSTALSFSAQDYTYNNPQPHAGMRSLSIPDINIPTSTMTQRRLPAISVGAKDNSNSNDSNGDVLNQSQIMIKQHSLPETGLMTCSLPQSKKPKVEIQNAILSTLITLGKQNFRKLSTSNSDDLVISRAAAMKYSKSYFENFYHLFPFIHKTQFYKDFGSLNIYNILHPSSTTPFLQLRRNFQTFLVLNIGFKNLHNSNSLTKEEIQQHGPIFNTSRITELIHSSLTFNTTEDIKVLTLLVIDSFFTKNCLSTTNLTNLLTGLALRYNFHRKLSKTKADEFSMFEIEMRYRLFWSIYIIDRTVAVYLNKLVAIPDEYINLPYPIFWSEFDSTEGDQTSGFNELDFQLVLELKQLEGTIHKEIHSVLAINHKSNQENEAVLKRLRTRIESWYLKTTTSSSTKAGLNNGNSSIWYTTKYYNCLTLLYRHSYLNPLLNDDLLSKLGKAVLQNLSYSYNSTINKSTFSINWMSFFRILIIFKTLLKCLVSGAVNVYESKTELNLCMELLKNYVNDNEDWNFVYDIIEIFQNILKMSFLEDVDPEQMQRLLKDSAVHLESLLKSNSVGCRLDDFIEDEYNLDDRINEEYNLK